MPFIVAGFAPAVIFGGISRYVNLKDARRLAAERMAASISG